MSWFSRKKPADPLSARERELAAEMERLRREVGRLSREDPVPVVPPPTSPPSKSRSFSAPVRPPPTPVVEPAPGHFNEFGVAKFDFGVIWRRWMGHLQGPPSNNPRMARMLAAGSVQGLRTLRYERRVARNRFIALFVILLLILWGLGYTYLRNR
jgi:hypothetical protein